MTFKKSKVVMLSTNQQATTYLALNPSTNKLRGIFNNDILLEYQRVGYETFHLYFTVNERPKIGDWYIVLLNGDIPALEQIKTINDNVWVNKELFETTRHIDNCFKIIACTDNLLSLECDCGYIKKVNTGLCSGCGRFTNIPLMPTPSSSFIDVYIDMWNKNTPIGSCMVEYKEMSGEELGCDPAYYPLEQRLKLKVDSKNQITIKKQKDSFTREEVIEFAEWIRNNPYVWNYLDKLNDTRTTEELFEQFKKK